MKALAFCPMYNLIACPQGVHGMVVVNVLNFMVKILGRHMSVSVYTGYVFTSRRIPIWVKTKK